MCAFGVPCIAFAAGDIDGRGRGGGDPGLGARYGVIGALEDDDGDCGTAPRGTYTGASTVAGAAGGA